MKKILTSILCLLIFAQNFTTPTYSQLPNSNVKEAESKIDWRKYPERPKSFTTLLSWTITR